MSADQHHAGGHSLPGVELHEVVAEIERAFDAGRFGLTAELLENDLLATWYGLPPERTRQILTVLAREVDPLPATLRELYSFVDSSAWNVLERPELSDTRDGAKFQGFIDMFLLRLQGRPVAGLRAMPELGAQLGPLQPIFDTNQGFGLFTTVQRGLTAMLAAEFTEALACFTTAQLHPRVPKLRFLVRDALVKHALLQALFGDPAEARRLAEASDEIERTSSWAELAIDADRTLVDAALSPDEEAVHRLQGLALHSLGEMWPFYVLVLHRALTSTGNRAEMVARLKLLEQVPFPKVEGEGVPGSVFVVLAAAQEAIAGKWAEARDLLGRADRGFALTVLVEAAVDVQVGRPGQALRATTALRERTQLLPQLERRRLGVVAGAHLVLGEDAAARSALEQVMRVGGGPVDQEMFYFSRSVRDFAAEHVEGWRVSGGGLFQGLAPSDGPAARLTKREREIVSELAKGYRREEVAANLFISINTLKKHMQSLYRKLEVSSWREAVIEAERRGLL